MAIQRISVNKTNHAIHWIVIYPVDSAIQPLNNRGQSCKRASRNQQNKQYKFNFRQASYKHLITFEPKAYLFFSKSLSKI